MVAMNKNKRKDLLTGKSWEAKLKKFLERLGYFVEEYVCYDTHGNETYQLYTYMDNKSYSHPDFIVTIKNKVLYIEAKYFGRFYRGKESKGFPHNGNFLSVDVDDFHSYLQLSEWKNRNCYIVFMVKNNWYRAEVKKLNKTKIFIKNAYAPKEYKNYYFWDIENLDILKN